MLISWAVVVASATAVCASPWSSLPVTLKQDSSGDAETRRPPPDLDVFENMFAALRDMQEVYFQQWLGTWPEAIDWTRAVMGTHIAATLRTISYEMELSRDNETANAAAGKEAVISGYFADLIAYYFAEDAFAIRNEAYDDMLWVVLGWLESIQFIHEHSALFPGDKGRGKSLEDELWYGNRWVPAFAHRARIFWELAAKGWDTKLCGGGMIWNPRLLPYKNAITNQLFISASISMYLHFPGDANTSPFNTPPNPPDHPPRRSRVEWRAHDPIFARAAQNAHKWLASSNMTNAQGLYADGFHISGHSSGSSNNTQCDERDEMVYTYNQGVILSGLLGLFRATGDEAYLREGHNLIENVIRATGYDHSNDTPLDDIARFHPGQLPPWRGLGRAGVLEDACDVSGKCSQDGQTFKGIWMHHFAAFCAVTALEVMDPDADIDEGVLEMVRKRHAEACRGYASWLRHNAVAALGTRDERGLFGMWWTAGLLRVGVVDLLRLALEALPVMGEGAVDYRNEGVPRDGVWMGEDEFELSGGSSGGTGQKPMGGSGRQQQVLGGRSSGSERGRNGRSHDGASAGDPNLRGRGRTVETQGGGLAVLRALWVVSKHER